MSVAYEGGDHARDEHESLKHETGRFFCHSANTVLASGGRGDVLVQEGEQGLFALAGRTCPARQPGPNG